MKSFLKNEKQNIFMNETQFKILGNIIKEQISNFSNTQFIKIMNILNKIL